MKKSIILIINIIVVYTLKTITQPFTLTIVFTYVSICRKLTTGLLTLVSGLA